MNIRRKGAGIAFTATLLSALLATVAVPIQDDTRQVYEYNPVGAWLLIGVIMTFVGTAITILAWRSYRRPSMYWETFEEPLARGLLSGALVLLGVALMLVGIVVIPLLLIARWI